MAEDVPAAGFRYDNSTWFGQFMNWSNAAESSMANTITFGGMDWIRGAGKSLWNGQSVKDNVAAARAETAKTEEEFPVASKVGIGLSLVVGAGPARGTLSIITAGGAEFSRAGAFGAAETHGARLARFAEISEGADFDIAKAMRGAQSAPAEVKASTGGWQSARQQQQQARFFRSGKTKQTADEHYLETVEKLKAAGHPEISPELSAQLFAASAQKTAPKAIKAFGWEFTGRAATALLIGAPIVYAANTQQGVGGFAHQLLLPRWTVSWSDYVGGTGGTQWDQAEAKKEQGAQTGALTATDATKLRPLSEELQLNKPDDIASAYNAMVSLSGAIKDKLEWRGVNTNDLISKIVRAGRDGSLYGKLDTISNSSGVSPAQKERLVALAEAVKVYINEQDKSLPRLDDNSRKMIEERNPEWLLGLPQKSGEVIVEGNRQANVVERRSVAELKRQPLPDEPISAQGQKRVISMSMPKIRLNLS